MFDKISLITFLGFISFQGGYCIILCRPKVTFSPFAVPSLALQSPFALGLSRVQPVSDCGPAPAPLPIIQAPPLTVPTIQGPIIPLPSPPIPCPKTIAHKCVCTKTIVKPQLIQRCITIPSIQRYLKRTYTPVVENIAYKARPKSCGCRGVCTCGTRIPPPRMCNCVRPPSAPICAPPPPLALPYSRIC